MPHPNQVLFVVWIGLLLLLPLIAAPSVDDGYFSAMPPILLHLDNPADELTNHYAARFLVLPGLLFAQDAFFLPYLAAGLPYTYYTAKLVVLLIGILLIYFSFKLFDDPKAESGQDGFLRRLLFLVLVGTGVFMEDVINIRPETTGLLATIVGILCFRHAGRSERPGRWRGLSGLALGIAATTHPTFILTTAGLGLLAMVLLLRRERWQVLPVPIVATLVPIALMVAWFLAHAPESMSQLLVHIDERNPQASYPGHSVLALLKIAGGIGLEGQSRLAQLYIAATRGLLVVSVVLALIAVAAALLRRSSRARLTDTHLMVATLFLLALLNLFVQNSPRTQYLVVLAFTSALALALHLPPGLIAAWSGIRLLSHRGLLLAAGLLALSAYPASHAAKSLVSGEARYHPRPLLQKVVPRLSEYRAVFVGDDRYLPAFLPQFVERLTSGDGPLVQWIFPHHITRELAQGAVGNIVCFLQEQPEAPILWVISTLFTAGDNLNAHDREARRLDFSMNVGKSQMRVRFVFDYDERLYRDRSTLALSGRIVRIEELPEDGPARPLYTHGMTNDGCAATPSSS